MSELIAPPGGPAAMPATPPAEVLHLPIWPSGQSSQRLEGAQIAVTWFSDHATYQQALTEAVLAAAHDSRFHDPKHLVMPSGCGRKVRNVPEWNVPAANLVHARALMFARQSLSRQQVFADDTWASIYGKGDYCMPHSHVRADVSIVYMLEPGDPDPGDTFAGKLYFADPRIEWTCPVERGRVVRPFIPDMAPGTMVLFAGEYLHGVHAYRGTQPRITMSWNLTLQQQPGNPREWAFRIAGEG